MRLEPAKQKPAREAGVSQNGRAGPNEAANRVAPNKRIRAEPPRVQIVHTASAKAPLLPPSFNASSREPSASVASTATVMAVPIAMAKVAATPAQNTPCVSAKMSTRIAPVHGLMPTENTTARTLRQEKGPASSRASTI